MGLGPAHCLVLITVVITQRLRNIRSIKGEEVTNFRETVREIVTTGDRLDKSVKSNTFPSCLWAWPLTPKHSAQWLNCTGHFPGVKVCYCVSVPQGALVPGGHPWQKNVKKKKHVRKDNEHMSQCPVGLLNRKDDQNVPAHCVLQSGLKVSVRLVLYVQ